MSIYSNSTKEILSMGFFYNQYNVELGPWSANQWLNNVEWSQNYSIFSSSDMHALDFDQVHHRSENTVPSVYS